jgi:hypothetical protein
MAAPLPAKIVEKGKLSNAVVVDVILKKYRDHSVPRARAGPMSMVLAQLHNR